MRLIKIIINYVYNKKISYLLYIKTNIINNYFLFLIFIFLSSCSFIETIKELELKVTKVGKIDIPASYIFIYPENYNNSLSYSAIIDKITYKLDLLGFSRITNKQKAKYVFIVNFDFFNKKYYQQNNTVFNNLNNSNNNSNIDIDNLFQQNFKCKTFIFEAYLLNNNGLYKVFEGHTISINNKFLKEADKGTLGFIMCSIDALFDTNLINISEYQEYYYKCL